MADVQVGYLIVLIFVFLSLSFLYSGSEVAFFSITSKKIEKLKKRKNKRDKQIVTLFKNPNQLLATILVANAFNNIAIIIISNLIFNKISWLHHIQDSYYIIFFLIKVVGLTILILLIGEILPKLLANRDYMKYIYAICPIIYYTYILLSPFCKWLVKTNSYMLKYLNKNKNTPFPIEELYNAIDMTGNQINEKERNILKSILNFGDVKIKNIMKPIQQASVINSHIKFPDLIQQIHELKYSRFPVIQNSNNQVLGIIHSKDIIPYLSEKNSFQFDWHPLIRPAFFISDEKHTKDLLKELQQQKKHFAIVQNLQQKAIGIITLEDLIEQVVGDIQDEYDDKKTTI